MLIPRTRSLATGSAGRVAVLNGAHTLICGAKEKHFKPNGGSTGSWKMTEKNHHSTPWNAMELTGNKTKNSPAVAVFCCTSIHQLFRLHAVSCFLIWQSRLEGLPGVLQLRNTSFSLHGSPSWSVISCFPTPEHWPRSLEGLEKFFMWALPSSPTGTSSCTSCVGLPSKTQRFKMF